MGLGVQVFCDCVFYDYGDLFDFDIHPHLDAKTHILIYRPKKHRGQVLVVVILNCIHTDDVQQTETSTTSAKFWFDAWVELSNTPRKKLHFLSNPGKARKCSTNTFVWIQPIDGSSAMEGPQSTGFPV